MKQILCVLWAMGAVCLLGAQSNRSAQEWLSEMLNAYSKATSLQQKATVSVLMRSARNPQGEPLQRIVYIYALEPPAKLNLTLQDTVSGKTTRVQSDGNSLTVQKENQESQKKLIANSGLALLEQLIAQDILPTYDMVFVFGGKTKQEEFLKQVSQLKIVSEDEKTVVLTARLQEQLKRPSELQIVLDKATARMLRFQVTTTTKIEGSEGAFVLLMEFEPLKPVDLHDLEKDSK